MKPHLISGGDGMGRSGAPMIGLTKVLIAALTASLISGSALVALTGGVGPGGGSDYGLDTDGDGLHDWLVVRMDLTVDEANYYSVWATLGTEEPFGRGCDFGGPVPLLSEMPNTRCGPDGRCYEGDPVEDFVYPISWASVREFLEAGDHTIALAFKGTDIGLAGVDGPYRVQAYVSADGGGPWVRGGPEPGIDPEILPPVPEGWTWEYTTSAYAAADFEEPRFAIRFTGVHADEGLDLDGDGLFDYLIATADADVSLAGTYWFDGSLTVPSDDGGPYRDYWVTSTYGTVDLAEGTQALEFRFNGGDIWASGHEGAFDFRLSVYYGGGIVYGYPDGMIREGPMPEDGGEFDVYGDTLCGRTAEYRHDAWEELVEPATFTGVFADRGEDWDGDGLFDVLAVDAEVDVTEANTFDFSGQLMSGDGAAWIAADFQQAYLEVGVQVLTLRFSGPAIRASGIDGPYRVDMNLVVAFRDPQATYTTGAYAHTDFDEEDQTRPQTHWIADLNADAQTIAVLVVRGDDLLTYVIEDTLLVEAFGPDGTAVFAAREKVYLPSGGSTQSFTFTWAPEPGTYVVRASLAGTGESVEIVVTV